MDRFKFDDINVINQYILSEIKDENNSNCYNEDTIYKNSRHHANQ